MASGAVSLAGLRSRRRCNSLRRQSCAAAPRRRRFVIVRVKATGGWLNYAPILVHRVLGSQLGNGAAGTRDPYRVDRL